MVFACLVGIGFANAAVRDASTISRETTVQNATNARASKRGITTSRTTTSIKPRSTVPTPIRATLSRATSQNNISRTGTTRTGATVVRTSNTTISRSGISQPTSRATTTTTKSKTFGTGYNTCRDAYFTCMDQFCAMSDETYRRCTCSSRLYEMKTKQRALAQSADQLQDFKDLNIDAIPKTAAEVHAMQTASDGELVASVIKDKSSSIAQLAGISAVLSSTKSKSLSTAGKLDIAGDINSIWATTDLTSGLNISNLTGETLYNAVHSQCVNLVADHCSSQSLLDMVVSAYSMYIENDCSLISNALDKQKTAANASIRETEREMNTARLENYDAHNASSINDCIAMVRQDITADAACGAGYVHCLDTSGLYLNKATGEPIYTSNFYQLGSMLSLSGDVLTNQTNRVLVTELNKKRMFATNSLDTCRDLADEVWDEFMRQAITEIYQSQQTKIRTVKNECLDVVNQCYDMQNNSLKDFSTVKEQLRLGARLELSEQLCREKLNACSNLYGGGPGGLQELVTAMYDITTQKIAQNCFATLQEYAKELCAVPTSDALHSYPYACRAYAPGEQQFASKWNCNKETGTTVAQSSGVYSDTGQESTQGTTNTVATDYTCSKKYTSCNFGYYMLAADGTTIIFAPYTAAEPGNRCVLCPARGCPQPSDSSDSGDIVYEQPCGTDYVGSLYQKLVRYAIQACMRPQAVEDMQKQSQYQQDLPDTLLQDVNATMDMIRASMASSLKMECERVGGYWVASQWNDAIADETAIKLFLPFYNETGANKKWGYCADPDTVSNYYNGDTTTTDDTDG